MRKITLKSLSLINFKGIRNKEILFNEGSTIISGENGTGKTTIFDAWLWLLFGKDSTGRSDSNFSIKTIDPETGSAYPKLEHSVTGVLDINGKEVKLQRSYVENWVKPRGATEEVLQNHKTEFYLNDVKLSTKREYDAEIEAIIPEDLFKMLTNPYYFTSLKANEQKAMLFDMAGDVTNEDVAGVNPEYLELLAELSGRSLEQFTRELAAKKRACNAELTKIPSQLETANRLKPEAEDWKALEKEMKEKQAKMAQLDDQINDKAKQNEQENNRKVGIQNKIGEAQLKLAQRKHEIREQLGATFHDSAMKGIKLTNTLGSLETELKRKKVSVTNLENQIEKVEQELNTLRGQFRQITAEEISYPDGAFICPTCKRPLEVEDVEAKQRELQANFNQNKANKLRKNKEDGVGKAAERDNLKAQLEKTHAEIAELEDKITTQQGLIEEEKGRKKETVDIDATIEADNVVIALNNEITELQNQLSMEFIPVDYSDLRGAKNVLNDSIQELYKELAKKEQIERADKEIEALEERKAQNNQMLAELEKWEYSVHSFQKDKDAILLERINGLFKYVSFSFVDEQLNGGEKLTCVATVNGTPYADANAAGKLNAGLDIINAICTAKGVSAPIFIDNRESINEILSTISQVVNLVVTKEPVLTIK